MKYCVKLKQGEQLYAYTIYIYIFNLKKMVNSNTFRFHNKIRKQNKLKLVQKKNLKKTLHNIFKNIYSNYLWVIIYPAAL